MNPIKRFIKTAGTYLVGNVLSKLVAVFLLPIYTAYLSPAEYGTYDVAISVLNIVMPIAFVQIWDGMYRFVFDCDNDDEKYGVVTNSLVVCAFGTCIFTAACLFAAPFLGNLWSPFMWLYGLTLSLQYEASYMARSFFRNALFSVSGVTNALVAALLNIVLICHFGWGVESIYLSAALGNVVQIAMICSSLKVLRHVKLSSVNWGLVIRMAKFSMPLCLTSLSFWLFNGFTKVAISFFLGTADNGLYGVVTRFTAAITMVSSVVQFAWNETSYLMAKNERRTAAYRSACRLLLWVLLAVSTVFPYVVKLVFPFFVSDSYAAAASLLPAATLGVMLNSYASFLSTIFATERMTSPILVSTLIGAAINIIATPLAIVSSGLMGGIWALAASYAAMALLRIVVLRSRLGISIGLRAFVPLVIMGVSYTVFDTSMTVMQTACILVNVVLCIGFASGDIKHAGLFRRKVRQ